jgi:hypothetical protein
MSSSIQPMPPFLHMERQRIEHAAWLDVVIELRERGVGHIERGEADYPLWAAITKWGEELAQLRMLDPNPQHALNEARERYEGQFERGEYPAVER